MTLDFFGFIIPALSFTTLSGFFLFWKYHKTRDRVSASVNQNGAFSFFFRYGRRVIYALSLSWAYGLYHYVVFYYPTSAFSLSVVMRYFAFSALFLLYIVFFPGLILTFFPRFFLNGLLIHLRRSVGVSVFFFAALHGAIGFLNNLSGNTIFKSLAITCDTPWKCPGL